METLSWQNSWASILYNTHIMLCKIRTNAGFRFKFSVIKCSTDVLWLKKIFKLVTNIYLLRWHPYHLSTLIKPFVFNVLCPFRMWSLVSLHITQPLVYMDDVYSLVPHLIPVLPTIYRLSDVKYALIYFVLPAYDIS